MSELTSRIHSGSNRGECQFASGLTNEPLVATAYRCFAGHLKCKHPFSGRSHELLGSAERRGGSCGWLRSSGSAQHLQFRSWLSPPRRLCCNQRPSVRSGLHRHHNLHQSIPRLPAPPTPAASCAARCHARSTLCVPPPGVGMDASSCAVCCQSCGRLDGVD